MAALIACPRAANQSATSNTMPNTRACEDRGDSSAAHLRRPVRESLDSDRVGFVEVEGADLNLTEHDGAVQEDHDALAGPGAHCECPRPTSM